MTWVMKCGCGGSFSYPQNLIIKVIIPQKVILVSTLNIYESSLFLTGEYLHRIKSGFSTEEHCVNDVCLRRRK